MNYIHTLEAEALAHRNATLALTDRFRELREHLARDKFAAIQADGSRGDWISTADVSRWLRYLEHGDHF